ncbi:MAG: hypothetical protein M1588_03000 [Planctomycetes bacterium]|nr:hypothetical protein [Planctomycetota bacterium]
MEKLYAEPGAAEGRALRLPGFSSGRLIESMGRNAQGLMAGRANHELPSRPLRRQVQAAAALKTGTDNLPVSPSVQAVSMLACTRPRMRVTMGWKKNRSCRVRYWS